MYGLNFSGNILYLLTILTEKDWCFTQFRTGMAGWLILIFFICLHNQLSSIHSIIAYYEHRYLKNAIHQIDGKNEWLHLSAKFTANFLARFAVFVLKSPFKKKCFLCVTESPLKMLKNAFFHLKSSFRSQDI